MIHHHIRALELRESRGGRAGLPVPNSPCGLRGRKATLNRAWSSEHRSCVKVEAAVLGSRSLKILNTVSVDVKQR